MPARHESAVPSQSRPDHFNDCPVPLADVTAYSRSNKRLVLGLLVSSTVHRAKQRSSQLASLNPEAALNECHERFPFALSLDGRSSHTSALGADIDLAGLRLESARTRFDFPVFMCLWPHVKSQGCTFHGIARGSKLAIVEHAASCVALAGSEEEYDRFCG